MSGGPEFDGPFEGLGEAGRRQVLQAMGASLGLAGLSACSTDQPDQRALPYIRAPEFMVPNEARHYATAVTTLSGYAQPVLGATQMGRPTKLEGLPGHPCSQGAADAFTQASILGLYDPGRSQTPRHAGQISDWNAFDAAMADNARRLDASQGGGFRLLTGQETSPTLIRQIEAMRRRWPNLRWHVFEPAGDEPRRAAAKAAFGRPLDVLPRLDVAEVVVSLDDDLLGPGPQQTRNGRLWSIRRLAFQAGDGQSLLFCAEPTPSLTGVTAQRRLAIAHTRIPLLIQALAARSGIAPPADGLTAQETVWVDAAAKALAGARGKALVSAGAQHPAPVLALAWRITEALDSLGALELRPPAAAPAEPFEALVEALRGGEVDTLVIIGANPVYAAPVDLAFAQAIGKARLSVHAGMHFDETARAATWHAPIEHELETWSDARAVDGTASLIQPLVRPFYPVRSRHALIEVLQGNPSADAHALVQATWRESFGDDFDRRWRQALRAGWIEGSQPPPITAEVKTSPLSMSAPTAGLEVVFRPDPSVWDGRFATNGELQELPKPLNKITWGAALAVSPALAARMDLATGDFVRLTAGGRTLEGPVWITPGQAADTITVPLGYGRKIEGQVGDGLGFDAYGLRTTAAPWAMSGAGLAKTGEHRRLAATQVDQAQGGHEMIRRVTPAAARIAPEPVEPSFYPAKREPAPQYGMSIDTDLCIGCNACISACDMENNIAVVGEEQVRLGRQMHWMRIDHYADGDPEAPVEGFQPVPCMHCEKAPCEMGCPVNATVHSPDGLNLQVYNRCIGTRTCSSYCPYKVRRFNWFDFTGNDPPARQAQRNPNVTVRSRGVMEKCTYCIQRISAARIKAKIEDRPVADGEVVTACQQTCPTQAIVFGPVSDPASAVSRRKASARDYALLPDENTRPRTTYLAQIRAPPEAG